MKTVKTKGNHHKGTLRNGIIRINEGEIFEVIKETKKSFLIKKGCNTKFMPKDCFYI